MNLATRQPLYKQIEQSRDTKVLSFVTGERQGFQSQIASDAVEPFVSILDNIGPTKRISLIIETNGGSTSAAWRIINVIRSFCDQLEVIVINKSMSAGTLMSLGANKIVMTKQAVLGPIDPSLENHPLSPSVVINGSSQNVPVSAEAIRGYIDEVKKDVTDQDAIAAIWKDLATQIHPLVLGQIFRLGEQIRKLAKDLIANQVSDTGIQDSIIQILCSDSGSHDYTINRKKAEDMGLSIEKPSAALYGILRDVGRSFQAELQTLEPINVAKMLGGATTANYTLVRGLIESASEGYGFTTDGQITVNPAAAGGVDDVQTFIGWRRLP